MRCGRQDEINVKSMRRDALGGASRPERCDTSEKASLSLAIRYHHQLSEALWEKLSLPIRFSQQKINKNKLCLHVLSMNA